MKNEKTNNEVTINLDKVVNVRIEDSSNYDPDRCHTGGQYLFWTDYQRVADGWEVSYGTSAEFDYCTICGNFGYHSYFDEESGEWKSECGEPDVITTSKLLDHIQEAAENDDLNIIYTQEWQNTSMEHQPIYQWKSQNSVEPRTPDCHTAFSYDRSRRWEITPNAVYLVDEYGYEAFSYHPDYCSMEEDGYDVGLCNFVFLHSCEELLSGDKYTDVYFDEVAEAMMDMSENLGLGWKMEELYCEEEYSDYYRIYSKEFAEKCYVGEDVSFCYSEEALVGAMVEEGNWSDFKKHPVVCIYPNGSYDEDEAYVVYHNKVVYKLSPAQEKVINSTIVGIDKGLGDINAIWEKRGVTDATAEPEWKQYERWLMLRCELGLGIE